MKAVKLCLCLCAPVAIGVGLCLYLGKGRSPQVDLETEFEQMEPRDKELGDFSAMNKSLGFGKAKPGKDRPAAKASEDGESARLTAEEKAEAEAEKLVEAFDALTDGWMEGKTTRTPTMKDVDAFAESFRNVPEDRKDECIHRALNLIPDENVMLLAGVLMDKQQPAEIVDAIFSDILNRDEKVKQPVLKEIIKDPKHKCWKDAAWILDVTKQPTEKEDSSDGR